MTECEEHGRSARHLRPEKDDAQCTLVQPQDDVLFKEAHHHDEVEGNDLHSHEHSHKDGVVHSHEHSHEDGVVHSHEHSHEGAHDHEHDEGSGDEQPNESHDDFSDEDYVDVYATQKKHTDAHEEEDVGETDYSTMKVARSNF